MAYVQYNPHRMQGNHVVWILERWWSRGLISRKWLYMTRDRMSSSHRLVHRTVPSLFCGHQQPIRSVSMASPSCSLSVNDVSDNLMAKFSQSCRTSWGQTQPAIHAYIIHWNTLWSDLWLNLSLIVHGFHGKNVQISHTALNHLLRMSSAHSNTLLNSSLFGRWRLSKLVRHRWARSSARYLISIWTESFVLSTQ